MQIAREQHVPVVATFHSKYRADFERAIPSRLLVDYLIRKVIRFYEAADEVWIPQAAVEETLREYGYKGRVEVVDNGNDFADVPSLESMRREARRELGLCSGEFMFLFVGQHIWEKNLGFLLDALALLPDVPFRMYFVGSGYANDELKQKVAGLGLSSKVTFVGSIVEREVLKRYYVATDLFLFPSLSAHPDPSALSPFSQPSQPYSSYCPGRSFHSQNACGYRRTPHLLSSVFPAPWDSQTGRSV